MSQHNPPTGAGGPDPIDLDATWGQAPPTPPPTTASGAEVRSSESTRTETLAPEQPVDVPTGPKYPRRSLATTAMVLSIAGIACCGLTAPFGLILGAVEIAAIDRGITDPANRGRARTAVILGGVACALLAAVVVLSIALGSMSTLRDQ